MHIVVIFESPFIHLKLKIKYLTTSNSFKDSYQFQCKNPFPAQFENLDSITGCIFIGCGQANWIMKCGTSGAEAKCSLNFGGKQAITY